MFKRLAKKRDRDEEDEASGMKEIKAILNMGGEDEISGESDSDSDDEDDDSSDDGEDGEEGEEGGELNFQFSLPRDLDPFVCSSSSRTNPDSTLTHIYRGRL